MPAEISQRQYASFRSAFDELATSDTIGKSEVSTLLAEHMQRKPSTGEVDAVFNHVLSSRPNPTGRLDFEGYMQCIWGESYIVKAPAPANDTSEPSMLQSLSALVASWRRGEQDAEHVLQRIEYMLPAPNSAAMIATPTNLIRTIFEWLDKDKNGVIEECELTTGLSVKPAETAVVQSMLGSFPNGLLSHAGFGCFLQGTFRMLFSLLDLDKNGRLDVNELAWVESAFNCPIPLAKSASLTEDNFQQLMLQCCVDTLKDGRFQKALLSILTLLEGARLQSGQTLDNLDKQLGVAVMEYWLSDRVDSVFQNLSVGEPACVTCTVEMTGDLPQVLRLPADSQEEEHEQTLDKDQFHQFVVKVTRLIGSSANTDGALCMLYANISDQQKIADLITAAKDDLLVFQCCVAQAWHELGSTDEAHYMTGTLVKAVGECNDTIQKELEFRVQESEHTSDIPSMNDFMSQRLKSNLV